MATATALVTDFAAAAVVATTVMTTTRTTTMTGGRLATARRCGEDRRRTGSDRRRRWRRTARRHSRVARVPSVSSVTWTEATRRSGTGTAKRRLSRATEFSSKR